MSTTYHVTWRSTGLMLRLVFLLIPLETTCAILSLMWLTPGLVNRSSGINSLVFSALVIAGIIFLTLLVAVLIYRIGTFLRLSQNGLEYHRWPFTTITCQWNELEKVSQGNVMGMSFATLMIPRKEIGWEVPMGGGALGSAKYKLVPLSDFQGWPDGDLMDELRQYAPSIFFCNRTLRIRFCQIGFA